MMHDVKRKVRVIFRRMDHLRSRITDKIGNSTSFDKAELGGLELLIRVYNVYNDARGPGGSHIENTLHSVRELLEDILDLPEIGEELEEGISVAIDRCDESMRLLRNIADHDDTEKHI